MDIIGFPVMHDRIRNGPRLLELESSLYAVFQNTPGRQV